MILNVRGLWPLGDYHVDSHTPARYSGGSRISEKTCERKKGDFTKTLVGLILTV